MTDMRILVMPQTSPEWWAAKRGIPSASNFEKILTPGGKLSTSADKYMCSLIADICSQNPNYFSEKGKPVNTYAIQNGINTEPEARQWYCMQAGLDVQQVGFIVSDCGRYGCSPDAIITDPAHPGRLVDSDWINPYSPDVRYKELIEAMVLGTLELKCPLLQTQAEYLIDSTLPSEYKPQCHGALTVTKTAYVDFVSYAHGLPPLLLKVEPSDYTVLIRAALDKFCERFEEFKTRLKVRPLT